MALCALGLVSGDATLAGAALGELMKRKNGKMKQRVDWGGEIRDCQTESVQECKSYWENVLHLLYSTFYLAGSEDLTGDICYLYSRFYALQVFFKSSFASSSESGIFLDTANTKAHLILTFPF